MGGDRRVRDAVVHSTTERCWRLGGRGEHAACGTATGGGWLQGPSSAAEAAAISIVTRPVAAAEASSLVHDAGATPQEHRTQQQQFRPSLLAFCYVQRRLRCISGLFSRKERPSPAQSGTGYPHSTTTGANREVSLCCQDLVTGRPHA